MHEKPGVIRRLFPVAFAMPALIAMFLLASGCETIRDASRDPQVTAVGYAPGQLYAATIVVAVLGDGANPGAMPLLDRNDDSLNIRYPGRAVVRVLSPGTLFRVERIDHVIIQAPVQGESFTEVIVSCPAVATPLRIGAGNQLSRWAAVRSVGGWPTLVQRPGSAFRLTEP